MLDLEMLREWALALTEERQQDPCELRSLHKTLALHQWCSAMHGESIIDSLSMQLYTQWCSAALLTSLHSYFVQIGVHRQQLTLVCSYMHVCMCPIKHFTAFLLQAS